MSKISLCTDAKLIFLHVRDTLFTIYEIKIKILKKDGYRDVARKKSQGVQTPSGSAKLVKICKNAKNPQILKDF